MATYYKYAVSVRLDDDTIKELKFERKVPLCARSIRRAVNLLGHRGCEITAQSVTIEETDWKFHSRPHTGKRFILHREKQLGGMAPNKESYAEALEHGWEPAPKSWFTDKQQRAAVDWHVLEQTYNKEHGG